MQRKDQSIKLSSNSTKKEIKKYINNQRDIKWEYKLKKFSSD